MSLRVTKVGAVVRTPNSTSEHPDKRRLNRIFVASDYNHQKMSNSSESNSESMSFKDVLKISAEGVKNLEESKKSN